MFGKIFITQLRNCVMLVTPLLSSAKQAVRVAATLRPAPVTLTFDFESGVRVTCDVGYLGADFSVPRPLYSRRRPDVRDRQTDNFLNVRQTYVRQHHRLMSPPRGGA